MTETSTCAPTCATTPADAIDDADVAPGWQSLAVAELGRPLTDAELAAAGALSPDEALDLLVPALSDAARQEALWALG